MSEDKKMNFVVIDKNNMLEILKLFEIRMTCLPF